MILWPSRDHQTPPTALSSPVSSSLRACSPVESINQSSWGPSLPLFVANAINEPSEEYDKAKAIERSIRDVPPGTENSQMFTPPRFLASSSVAAGASKPAGCAVARNLRLSGDQAAVTKVIF